jgi:hypothetical protein
MGETMSAELVHIRVAWPSILFGCLLALVGFVGFAVLISFLAEHPVSGPMVHPPKLLKPLMFGLLALGAVGISLLLSSKSFYQCSGCGLRTKLPEAKCGKCDTVYATENLITMLANELRAWELDRRIYAIKELGKIGSEATIILPQIIRFFRLAPDCDESSASMDTIVQMGPNVIPKLIEAIGDTSPGIKKDVAICLGKFGTHARQAVPVLTELTKNPKKQVRQAAQQALEKITARV